MLELDLDLRDLQPEDTARWPDEPFVGDLLMTLQCYAGQKLKVRLFAYHEAPGPNWGMTTPVPGDNGGTGRGDNLTHQD